MRPLRMLLLVLFGIGCATFIALVIPGVLFAVRNCSGGQGLHKSTCRQGVILASVAAGMLLLALASALALIWVKELPAAAQAGAGLQGKGAQVTPIDARGDAYGSARPTQDQAFAMQAQPPYQLYYNPLAPAFQDYPGAASRLEWHLAASQQLLWSLLYPQPPAQPGPPPHPLDPHPVPGQPYFDWDSMPSVLPGIQGGRYLQPHSMGASSLMGQGGAAAPGLPASGAPSEPIASTWEFQAPRRGTKAYVQRLEDMQGPNWRPVSSAGAQPSTLIARQAQEIHLDVLQSASVTDDQRPGQMRPEQGPAHGAKGVESAPQHPAAPAAALAGPTAPAANGAQGQGVAQPSMEVGVDDQPIAPGHHA